MIGSSWTQGELPGEIQPTLKELSAWLEPERTISAGSQDKDSNPLYTVCE